MSYTVTPILERTDQGKYLEAHRLAGPGVDRIYFGEDGRAKARGWWGWKGGH